MAEIGDVMAEFHKMPMAAKIAVGGGAAAIIVIALARHFSNASGSATPPQALGLIPSSPSGMISSNAPTSAGGSSGGSSGGSTSTGTAASPGAFDFATWQAYIQQFGTAAASGWLNLINGDANLTASQKLTLQHELGASTPAAPAANQSTIPATPPYATPTYQQNAQVVQQHATAIRAMLQAPQPERYVGPKPVEAPSAIAPATPWIPTRTQLITPRFRQAEGA